MTIKRMKQPVDTKRICISATTRILTATNICVCVYLYARVCIEVTLQCTGAGGCDATCKKKIASCIGKFAIFSSQCFSNLYVY